MYVHLKQSGETLKDKTRTVPWTPDELYASAVRIGEVQTNAERLGIQGLMVVSGAGNLVRGDGVRELFGPDSAVSRVSDVAGRWATAQNAIILGGALTDMHIPHKFLAAPGMEFTDPHLGRVDPYDPESLKEAYNKEQVALVLGGSGKDNQTTDAAVMDYALLSGANFSDGPSVALKATELDGIFTADPKVEGYENVQKFEAVSASYMIENKLGGVDAQCLRVIAAAEGDVELLVYSARHSPLEALRADRGTLGTIITSQLIEPRLVEAAVVG